MTDDDFIDQREFKHEPASPVRPNHVGEAVYLRTWQKLLTEHSGDYPNERFAAILVDVAGPLTQRDATLAASFMRWLGTSCGQSFLMAADRRAGLESQIVEYKPHAYLALWAIENRRIRSVNCSIRTLEAMLVTDWTDVRLQTGLLYQGCPGVELTARDLEVADALAFWLGTVDGQDFVATAQKQIEAEQVRLNEATRLSAEAHRLSRLAG